MWRWCGPAPTKVSRGFVVPTDTAGFSAPDIGGKLSLRASHTSELIMDDVRLPADAVLPGVASMRGPLSCLTEARYGIAWGSMGAARACYEAALDYATTRRQFGKPIAAFQLTQRKLVDMMVAINRGTLVALHIGRMKDEGLATPEHVSFGKFDNVRAALEIAREARSVLGANGITLEYPVIRHMKQPRVGVHVRGHQRDPHADPWPGRSPASLLLSNGLLGSEEARSPELHSRLINRLPFFYGWVVLGAASLVSAFTIPGQTVGISVFLDSIIADLGHQPFNGVGDLHGRHRHRCTVADFRRAFPRSGGAETGDGGDRSRVRPCLCVPGHHSERRHADPRLRPAARPGTRLTRAGGRVRHQPVVREASGHGDRDDGSGVRSRNRRHPGDLRASTERLRLANLIFSPRGSGGRDRDPAGTSLPQPTRTVRKTTGRAW